MTPQQWQVVLGLLGFVAMVVGVGIKLAGNYLNQLRADIKATQDLDVRVGAHEAQIIEILRRLASLEGGIKESMYGLDRRLTEVNNSVIRLETSLKFTEQIRGLLGRRHTDAPEE